MAYSQKLKAIFLILFLLVVLVACRDLNTEVPKDISQSDLISSTFTATARPLWTLVGTVGTFAPLSSTRTPTPTAIPTMTINPAHQPWLFTAISISGTKSIELDQAREMAKSEIVRFVIECEGVTQNAQDGSLSPNKNWISTSCGRHNLIVQNSESTIRWELEFEDFLHPNLQSQGMPGRIYPMFWDADESYLYFSTEIGWSGGGDECFSWNARTGLFRLNLKNGTWVTLVNPSEHFPGDHIEISPTGRRYVSDISGILITDVYTGEVIRIQAENVMNFEWSPDGTKLAYSTANCTEEGFVVDSSVSVWDALTNEVHTIFAVEKEVLTPLGWDDNSVLRFESEKYIGLDAIYTLYVLNTVTNEILFIGPSSALSQ